MYMKYDTTYANLKNNMEQISLKLAMKEVA